MSCGKTHVEFIGEAGRHVPDDLPAENFTTDDENTVQRVKQYSSLYRITEYGTGHVEEDEPAKVKAK